MTDKANSKRLYLVVDTTAGTEKIIEAGSQAQAIRIAIGERFTAEAASAREVARVMAAEYAAKGGSA